MQFMKWIIITALMLMCFLLGCNLITWVVAPDRVSTPVVIAEIATCCMCLYYIYRDDWVIRK